MDSAAEENPATEVAEAPECGESSRTGKAFRREFQSVVAGLSPSCFGDRIPTLAGYLLGVAVGANGGDEGSIWILDETDNTLVPAYNTGPRADELVGKIRQPVGEGLIGRVFETGLGSLDNDLQHNVEHSKVVDDTLGQVTFAMAAVPFYLGGERRGVVTSVQLTYQRELAKPLAGFNDDAVDTLRTVSKVIADLVEFRLIKSILGWDE